MSYHEGIEIEDGVKWGVGSQVFGPAVVMVPIDEVGNMSDTEIGRRVRELMPFAAECFAKEILQYWGTYYNNSQNHVLLEMLELLDGYESNLINELKFRIRFNPETHKEKEPKAKKEKRPGFVYLAYAETGQHKIGISKNPQERIKVFDTIMPINVQLVHAFAADDAKEAENILHTKFESKRRDGEWFNLDESDINLILGISCYQDGQLR
jgi:hypothetical protein